MRPLVPFPPPPPKPGAPSHEHARYLCQVSSYESDYVVFHELLAEYSQKYATFALSGIATFLLGVGLFCMFSAPALIPAVICVVVSGQLLKQTNRWSEERAWDKYLEISATKQILKLEERCAFRDWDERFAAKHGNPNDSELTSVRSV